MKTSAKKTQSHTKSSREPACVITTVSGPTEAVRAFSRLFPGGNLIVVGDLKTPLDWNYAGVTYLAPGDASMLRFQLDKYSPVNHYARKNLGYLKAMERGASLIYDTDDDNIPLRRWQLRQEKCEVDTTANSKWWCNVYRVFGHETAWPRGYPLDFVRGPSPKLKRGGKSVRWCPIQQGMANESPDVDAVCRLTGGGHFDFDIKKSIALVTGEYCPFNSQTTWWWPDAYMLMYLPVTAPFRMTDIWRSFVAQRCLQEIEGWVAFHSPAEVVQRRNAHDLMADFSGEVEGYLYNKRIVTILNKLNLDSGPASVGYNMVDCYAALVREGILPKEELISVLAWKDDVDKLQKKWKH